MTKSDSKPLVSIITLNYNGEHFLTVLFDSLRRCTYPNLELIMVDNFSGDDSITLVEKNYPEVKIIRNPANYMYARGNNEGIKQALGEIICLINNDVEVDPGFVEPIVEAFQAFPELGAAQPKILGMEKRDHLEYAGACGGYIDCLGYPFLRGRLFFTTEKDEGQYDYPAWLFWASGACIFLRRQALEETGLLDEDFQIHMEEIDLCWRLHLHGWKLMNVPRARVWHHVGGTLDQDNPRKTYWNFRNNIFMLVKNFSTRNLMLRLPIRILLDFMAFSSEFVKLHFANALAVLKAYFWLFTHVPLLLRKRREVQQHRKVSEKEALELMYPGSIVLEYFLLKRKRFRDLLFHAKFQKKIIVENFPIPSQKTGVKQAYERETSHP